MGGDQLGGGNVRMRGKWLVCESENERVWVERGGCGLRTWSAQPKVRGKEWAERLGQGGRPLFNAAGNANVIA